MKRALLWLALAGVSACVGFNIRSPDNCAALCQIARDCGFLPSMLGWDPDGDTSAAEADCVRRCDGSPSESGVVQGIVDCLQTEAQPGMSWCDDDSSLYHGAWANCAAISECLRKTFGENEEIGDVDLTVQMMRFTDYETHIGPVAEVYAARIDAGNEVLTCDPALCGQDTCKDLVCEQASCTDTDGLECADMVCSIPGGDICSTALCRVGGLSITSVCSDLGVQRITLQIRERTSFPVTQVAVDVMAGLNSNCSDSTWVQDDVGSYRIKPGPVQIDAEVVGQLPGNVLEPFGLLPPGAAADDTVTQFCVKFLGPPMITRAGPNRLIIPLGDRSGLEALAASGSIQRCSP